MCDIKNRHTRKRSHALKISTIREWKFSISEADYITQEKNHAARHITHREWKNLYTTLRNRQSRISISFPRAGESAAFCIIRDLLHEVLRFVSREKLRPFFAEKTFKMSDREIVQQCERLLETVRQLSGQMENQNRSQSPTNINRRELAGVFGRASVSTESVGSLFLIQNFTFKISETFLDNVC